MRTPPHISPSQERALKDAFRRAGLDSGHSSRLAALRHNLSSSWNDLVYLNRRLLNVRFPADRCQ